MSILDVTDITKTYGGIRALAGCTMSFEEGAINGLIGPNGSGKTTLFNVITGYESADSGQVSLRGENITNAKPDQVFRRGVGRTFQITRIFPRLTVLENVHVAVQRTGFVAQARGWNSAGERGRALEVLDFVGLSRLAPEPAGGLSYGQQKLLEFAFIMVARPKVMLLDEPEHMTHRRFILPSFHGQRMRGYGEMMVEVAREDISKFVAIGWESLTPNSARSATRAADGSGSTRRHQ